MFIQFKTVAPWIHRMLKINFFYSVNVNLAKAGVYHGLPWNNLPRCLRRSILKKCKIPSNVILRTILLFYFFCYCSRGSEFSSYEIELWNRLRTLTHNDVTLWVANLKIIFYLRATDWKLKNKKLHFGLLTGSRKVKGYTSCYVLQVKE